MSWYMILLGVIAIAVMVGLTFSLTFGGWAWPTFTGALIAGWWFASRLVPDGKSDSFHN